MKLCIVGTGYVGLVSGVCFSDIGNDVICVDNDQNKIQDLNKGKIPIYEPGLDELVKKNYKARRLNFTTDIDYSIKKSNLVNSIKYQYDMINNYIISLDSDNYLTDENLGQSHLVFLIELQENKKHRKKINKR